MKDKVYLALIVLFSSISTSLQAANIHYPLFFFNNTAEYRRGIVVEGDIVAGAHIKFQDIVETIFDPDFEDKQLVAVYLFSNGGSVDEALKIGRLVRRLKLAAFKPGSVPIFLACEKLLYHPKLSVGQSTIDSAR